MVFFFRRGWTVLVTLRPRATACSPTPPPPDVEFRIPVEAAEVSTGTVEELVVATGTLRAPPRSSA